MVFRGLASYAKIWRVSGQAAKASMPSIISLAAPFLV
jgi:hypothetical protein